MSEIGGPIAGSGGPRDVRALFATPAQLYIAHLKQQFKGTNVEGLAQQVEELLANPKYGAAVGREVDSLRLRAIQSRFINKYNELTLRAQAHIKGWYPFPQGVPNYQGYVSSGLDDIIGSYKPKEAKK